MGQSAIYPLDQTRQARHETAPSLLSPHGYPQSLCCLPTISLLSPPPLTLYLAQLFRSAEMGDEVDDQARQMDEQARDKQATGHDLLQPSSSPKRTSKRTTVSLQHLTRSLQDTAVVTRKWSTNKPPMFGRSKFQAS